MTGKYYLSDILNPSRFKSGYINLIQAPVGSGKTNFALNELPKHALSNDYMLYITDSNMNREQILATYKNVCGYKKSWRDFLNSQTKPTIRKGWGTMASKITIMNYAQVAALINYGHTFDWSQFDYVVCDELHNLIYYKNIKQKSGSSSILKYTIDKIQDTLLNHPHVKIIGMTATPTKVFESFSNVYTVLTPQEMSELKRYDIINKPWYYRDYVKVLRAIPQGRKGIIYFDHVGTIKDAEAILQERGHKTGSFWSIVNEDHPMTDYQKSVRQYIINNQMIPSDVDILLINASAQTGVNIKNTDITFMIIHAAEGSDTLIQARGRLRNDLNNLYYYDKDSVDMPSPVPIEYLNRKITVAEMKQVCAEVRFMKPKGNDYYKTEKVVEYLNQHGYKIDKTTIGHSGKQRGYYIELL